MLDTAHVIGRYCPTGRSTTTSAGWTWPRTTCRNTPWPRSATTSRRPRKHGYPVNPGLVTEGRR